MVDASGSRASPARARRCGSRCRWLPRSATCPPEHGGGAPAKKSGELPTFGGSGRAHSPSMRSPVLLLTCAALAAVPLAGRARAQTADALPFAPGERLTFEGKVRAGVSGGGALWVEGPVELRGRNTWLLHSDMEGRVGPFRATDRNASWLDPLSMTALRYTSRERHIVSRHDDAVDIYAGEKRWSAEGGAEGVVEGSAPLDELSFLYYLRTLPLVDDETLTLARHFDTARNPT